MSALLQNNLAKNGQKRAAFGDVSNTANLVRINRDDPAVKVPNKVSEKPSLLPAERKPAVLAQPAQRPMLNTGLRGVLNTTNPRSIEVPGKQQPLANTRNTLAKRDNLIYRDVSSQPSNEAKAPASKEVTNEVVEVSEESYGSHPSTAPDSLNADGATEELKNQAPADEYSVHSSEHAAVRETADAKDDDDDCKVHGEYKAPEAYATVPEFNETSRSSRYHHQSITLSHPSYDQGHAHSEPEEYWDDDDYENEEEDGYVTVRSYRSRGDNTTGGATTVLFPRYSNQVKRELALAKEIVEATRTVEDIEDEYWDTSMVAEYNDEIFDYIRQQEVSCSNAW